MGISCTPQSQTLKRSPCNLDELRYNKVIKSRTVRTKESEDRRPARVSFNLPNKAVYAPPPLEYLFESSHNLPVYTLGQIHSIG